MFYLFHHMPKCGGTSFVNFLHSIFNVHDEYHTGNKITHPDEFEEYKENKYNLNKLSSNDCLVGHYNIDGIKLWQRYPDINNYQHKKFSILRDPLSTAISGVRSAVKRGECANRLGQQHYDKMLLNRANYFSKVLGINSEDDIADVVSTYWFIGSIENISDVMRLISQERGVPLNAKELPWLNTTGTQGISFSQEIAEEFKIRAKLDYQIYNYAEKHFMKIISNCFEN